MQGVGTGEADLYVPNSVVHSFLGGSGNQEGKVVLTGLYLTEIGLADEISRTVAVLNRRQGTPPAWELDYDDVEKYRDLSIGPIAEVVTRSRSGEWHINPELWQERLALVGAVGSWSLQNADLSVQQVLGKSGNKGKIRAPSVRFQIYQVLNNAETPQTRADIVHELGEDLDINVRNNLKTLTAGGMLRRNKVPRPKNPDLIIDHTEYHHTSIAFEALMPDVKALYAAMGRLGAGRHTTLHEILDVIKELDESVDTAVMAQRIRERLYQTRPDGKSLGFPGLRLVSRPDAKSSHPNYEIDDSVAVPIDDLLTRIETVQNGSKVEEYIDEAKDILSTEEKVYTLMDKAKRFSPFVGAAGVIALQRQVLAVVSSSDRVTADEALSAVRERYDISIDPDYMRKLLNQLAADGRVISEAMTPERHSNKTVNTYRLTGKILAPTPSSD